MGRILVTLTPGYYNMTDISAFNPTTAGLDDKTLCGILEESLLISIFSVILEPMVLIICIYYYVTSMKIST